jgi:hypothetical protein
MLKDVLIQRMVLWFDLHPPRINNIKRTNTTAVNIKKEGVHRRPAIHNC